MKKHIKLFITHPLIAGSTVIFAGTLFANIFNFLFNLYMSRNLKLEEYGTLVSVVSLITLLTIPFNSIVPTLVNFAGNHISNHEFGLAKSLYLKSIKIVFIICILITLFFIPLINRMQEFFRIGSSSIMYIAGLMVLVGYFSVINTAFLQAKLAFKFISTLNFLSTLIKFILGIGFVILGYGIGGVMLALLVASLLPYFLAFLPLNFIFKDHVVSTGELKLKDIMLYGAPSAIAIFGLAALTSTDLLLVKHFFSPAQAGLYAGLSLVGKVIFFFTAPIGTVMFPLIVKNVAKKESYKNTFRIAFMIVLVCSLAITLFYFKFPDFSILFFLKNVSYLAVKSNLALYATFTTLYSMVSLFVYYFLSINKTKVYIPLVTAAVVQAILIVNFHNTFTTVINMSILVTSVLFVLFCSYYLHTQKEER